MNTYTHNQKRLTQKNSKGFALLFTVLVITLILTITVGISSITFKQGILSGYARDSQRAFYEADSLLECALAYHLASSDGLYDVDEFTCGSVRYEHDGVTSTGQLYYTSDRPALGSCAVVRVIPRNVGDRDGSAALQVSGYNICSPTPRQVERTLLVTF